MTKTIDISTGATLEDDGVSEGVNEGVNEVTEHDKIRENCKGLFGLHKSVKRRIKRNKSHRSRSRVAFCKGGTRRTGTGKNK